MPFSTCDLHLTVWEENRKERQIMSLPIYRLKQRPPSDGFSVKKMGVTLKYLPHWIFSKVSQAQTIKMDGKPFKFHNFNFFNFMSRKLSASSPPPKMERFRLLMKMYTSTPYGAFTRSRILLRDFLNALCL